MFQKYHQNNCFQNVEGHKIHFIFLNFYYLWSSLMISVWWDLIFILTCRDWDDEGEVCKIVTWRRYVRLRKWGHYSPGYFKCHNQSMWYAKCTIEAVTVFLFGFFFLLIGASWLWWILECYSCLWLWWLFPLLNM